MQALLFRCRCGAGLPHINPEHATNIWNDEIFCSMQCMATAQSVSKCRELGIPFQPDMFILPLRLEGS